ncbi:MAG: hypothetical protein Ct9H300mP7_2880 [Verrucomicrobiota bacterium]|nr:MAG: hypothetical protein Ct9H300mP7_2880 [Verrucomicrobiota bacterium]
MGCGTLAREIEDNVMQMVAVKPIARWQVWLGSGWAYAAQRRLWCQLVWPFSS